MTKLYKVSYFIRSDESGTLYTTTTTFEGIENMYLDKGIEILEWEATNEN